MSGREIKDTSMQTRGVGLRGKIRGTSGNKHSALSGRDVDDMWKGKENEVDTVRGKGGE